MTGYDGVVTGGVGVCETSGDPCADNAGAEGKNECVSFVDEPAEIRTGDDGMNWGDCCGDAMYNGEESGDWAVVGEAGGFNMVCTGATDARERGGGDELDIAAERGERTVGGDGLYAGCTGSRDARGDCDGDAPVFANVSGERAKVGDGGCSNVGAVALVTRKDCVGEALTFGEDVSRSGCV